MLLYTCNWIEVNTKGYQQTTLDGGEFKNLIRRVTLSVPEPHLQVQTN